jgi:hypothetical protein
MEIKTQLSKISLLDLGRKNLSPPSRKLLLSNLTRKHLNLELTLVQYLENYS